MSVYTLSGIGSKASRKAKKAARKEKRAAKKEQRKDKRAVRKEKIKAKVKKLGRVFKKIGFASNRGAFLALVRLNVFGLGRKISKAIDKDPEKVKNIWDKKLGGNFNKLKQTAAKAKNKKEHPSNDNTTKLDPIEGIGVEPTTTTVAAAITAATPIIIMVVKVLREILPKKDVDNLEQVAGKLGQEYQAANGSTVEEDLQTAEEADEETRQARYGNSSSIDFKPSTTGLIGAAVGASAGFLLGKKKNKIIFAAAGAAAGYFGAPMIMGKSEEKEETN